MQVSTFDPSKLPIGRYVDGSREMRCATNLESLSDFLVLQNVKVCKSDIVLVQDLDDLSRESALGRCGLSLHKQQDGSRVQQSSQPLIQRLSLGFPIVNHTR